MVADDFVGVGFFGTGSFAGTRNFPTGSWTAVITGSGDFDPLLDDLLLIGDGLVDEGRLFCRWRDTSAFD